MIRLQMGLERELSFKSRRPPPIPSLSLFPSFRIQRYLRTQSLLFSSVSRLPHSFPPIRLNLINRKNEDLIRCFGFGRLGCFRLQQRHRLHNRSRYRSYYLLSGSHQDHPGRQDLHRHVGYHSNYHRLPLHCHQGLFTLQLLLLNMCHFEECN